MRKCKKLFLKILFPTTYVVYVCVFACGRERDFLKKEFHLVKFIPRIPFAVSLEKCSQINVITLTFCLKNKKIWKLRLFVRVSCRDKTKWLDMKSCGGKLKLAANSK